MIPLTGQGVQIKQRVADFRMVIKERADSERRSQDDPFEEGSFHVTDGESID